MRRFTTWPIAAVFLLLLVLASAACIRARPRPDVRPRRDGVLSIEVVPSAPAPAKPFVLWVPIPRDEPSQVLRGVRTTLPDGATSRSVDDTAHGNPAVRVEIPAGATAPVRVEFTITRAEERHGARLPAAPAEPVWDGKSWKQDEGLAIADERVRGIAAEIFKDAPDEDAKAKRAFDYVLANMRYAKEGTGWGTGSTKWACDAKYGNCTDFHALFISLLHAGGVAARFRIGFPLPAKPAKAEVIAGYHCWAEYYSPKSNGWVPVDASEAWKHAEKRAYLFGTLDPDRVGMSLGRDLVFDGQKGLPLNYFVQPYAESEGTPVRIEAVVRWTDS